MICRFGESYALHLRFGDISDSFVKFVAQSQAQLVKRLGSAAMALYSAIVSEAPFKIIRVLQQNACDCQDVKSAYAFITLFDDSEPLVLTFRPHNIMMGTDSQVWLVDFGWSRFHLGLSILLQFVQHGTTKLYSRG
jgi:hypothetical protein